MTNGTPDILGALTGLTAQQHLDPTSLIQRAPIGPTSGTMGLPPELLRLALGAGATGLGIATGRQDPSMALLGLLGSLSHRDMLRLMEVLRQNGLAGEGGPIEPSGPMGPGAPPLPTPPFIPPAGLGPFSRGRYG